MVMKLYPEFEPAIQFAKTVGEVEYAKLMELYTAWKSGAIEQIKLGTYYGRQSWDDAEGGNWPSDLKDGDMFLGEFTGVTYIYVASTNVFYPISNGGYRGVYSEYERYIAGQLVIDTGNKLYVCVAANMQLQESGNITEYCIGCALTNTTYWAALGGSGDGGGSITADASRNYKGSLSELTAITTGTDNIALGFNALRYNQEGSNNIAIGNLALQNMLYNGRNVAIGFNVLPSFRSYGTVAIGDSAGYANEYGYNCTFVGPNSGYQNTSGNGNTALGNYAGFSNQAGYSNTAVGSYAGAYNLGNYNSHLGFQAGNGYSSTTYNYSYNTAIGAYSVCTGSNQVQLGGSGTTTYVYGTVQNRSDIRDKADVVDTTLGIEFITGLRAVEGVWDHRDDYYTESEVVDKDGNVGIIRTPAEKDGSKKRSRKHQWFIAQEVKELCDRLGVDFGGYQDHSINGGADVLSLGYDEFIPPAVKAIQECWSRLDKLEARISKLEQ